MGLFGGARADGADAADGGGARIDLRSLPQALRAHLSRFDLDADGYVDEAELDEAVRCLEAARSGTLSVEQFPERLRPTVAALDDEGNGMLEIDELAEMVELYAAAKEANKSGEIAIKTLPKEIQPTLKVFDVDGDGTVAPMELARAAELYQDSKNMVKRLTRLAAALLLLMGVMLAAITGLTFSVVELSKESKVGADGAMVSAADANQAVRTAAAEFALEASSDFARRRALQSDSSAYGGGDTAVMRSSEDGSVLAVASAPLRASRLSSRLPDSAFEELKELDVRSGTGARLVLAIQGWTRLPRGCKGADSTVVLLTAAGNVDIEDEVLRFQSKDSMDIFERAGFTVDFGMRRLTGMYELVGFFNAIDNWEGLEVGEAVPAFPPQFHTVFRMYYRCYDPANPPPPRSPGTAECMETDEDGNEPDAGKLSVCGAEYDEYKMVQAGQTYTWVEGEMWMDGPLSREEYRYPVRAPNMRLVYIVNDTDPSLPPSERKRFFQIDDTPEDFFMDRLEASGERLAIDAERNRTGVHVDGAREIGLELGLNATDVERALRSDGRVQNGTDASGNATFVDLFDLYDVSVGPGSADPYDYNAGPTDPNATTGDPPSGDPTPLAKRLELLAGDDPEVEAQAVAGEVMDNYAGIRMPRGRAGGALSCNNGTFADMGLNASTATDFNITGVYNGDVFLAEAAGGVTAREFLMRSTKLDDVSADVRLFDRALDPAEPDSPRVPVKATIRYQDQDFYAVYDLFEAFEEYDPAPAHAAGLFDEWPEECGDMAVSKGSVLHRNIFEIRNLSPFPEDVYVTHGALMNEFKGSFLSEEGFRGWVRKVYGAEVLARMVIDWKGYDPDAEEGEAAGGDEAAGAGQQQSGQSQDSGNQTAATRRRLMSGDVVPLVPKSGAPLRHLQSAAMPKGAHQFTVNAFGQDALDDAMRQLDAAAEATISRGLKAIEPLSQDEELSALDAFDRSMAEYYAGGAGTVMIAGKSGVAEPLATAVDARRPLASAASARRRNLLATKKSKADDDADGEIPFMIGISYGNSFSHCTDSTLIGINLGIFGLSYSDPKFCAVGVSAEVDVYGVTIEGSLAIDYNPSGSGLEVSGCVSFSVGCSKKICGSFSEFVSYTFMEFCIIYGFNSKWFPYNGGRTCWQSYIKGELTISLGTCNAGPQVDLVAAIQFDMMMDRECEKAKCAETCRQWGEDALDVWPCIYYTCEPVNTYTVYVDTEISVGALFVCGSVFSARIMKYGPKVMSRGKEVAVSSVASVWGEQPIKEYWGNMNSGQAPIWPWASGIGGGINCPKGTVMSGYWRGSPYITGITSVMCVDVPSYQRMSEVNANGEENAAHWNFGSSINPWGGTAQQDVIYISNSWWTLDQHHYWTHCPDGYAIKNFTRNTGANCPYTFCIEAVFCSRVTHRDFVWTRKVAVIHRPSDRVGGWHGCPYDLPYLQGIHQTSCHNTYCWDYFYCSGDKRITWPGMKPRLGGLETKVVDHMFSFGNERGDWMCEHGWNGWVLGGFYRTNGRNIKYLDRYLCVNVGKVVAHSTWNYCSRKGRGVNEADHKNCFDGATQMYCDVGSGYVMRGIYTNKGESIHRIEFFHCAKIAAAMECNWVDNSQAFDSEGWSTCPKEYPFLAGLQRVGSGAMLSNIDNFLCCRIKASTSNKLAAKEYEYAGCTRRHHDAHGVHYALGAQVTYLDNARPDTCRSHCRSRGSYQYFGIFQGHWCDCYEEDPRLIHGLEADSSCNWGCRGDPNQMCGNLHAASVFIDSAGPKWEHCASINAYGMPSVQTRCTFKGDVARVEMRMGRGPRNMNYQDYHYFGWDYKSFTRPDGTPEDGEWGVDCTTGNFPNSPANEYRYCQFDSTASVRGTTPPSCEGHPDCFCPSGKNANMEVSAAHCYDAAVAMFGSFRVAATRSSLVGPGSWGWVPSGCSVQSGGDWAAHYNTHSNGNNDGSYTRVKYCTFNL